MKSFKLRKIDKRLELAKKKFLKDWNDPNFFQHEEKMIGPEKLFQIFKQRYLNNITVKEAFDNNLM